MNAMSNRSVPVNGPAARVNAAGLDSALLETVKGSSVRYLDARYQTQRVRSSPQQVEALGERSAGVWERRTNLQRRTEGD